VPGAQIRGQTRRSTLTLTAEIETTDGPIHFRQEASTDPSGQVDWTVPYAKVDRGGVRFNGLYAVNSVPLRSVVSEQAVQSGQLIDVGKID
jgi:hypothetical protein